MATHSSILAWKIPWTDDPGGLRTVHGVAKSWTRLSNWAHTQTHTHNSCLPIFFSPSSSLSGTVLFLYLRPLSFHSWPENLILSAQPFFLFSAAPLYLTLKCINLGVVVVFSLCKLNMEKTKIEELINPCKKNMSGWDNEVPLKGQAQCWFLASWPKIILC